MDRFLVGELKAFAVHMLVTLWESLPSTVDFFLTALQNRDGGHPTDLGGTNQPRWTWYLEIPQLLEDIFGGYFPPNLLYKWLVNHST